MTRTCKQEPDLICKINKKECGWGKSWFRVEEISVCVRKMGFGGGGVERVIFKDMRFPVKQISIVFQRRVGRDEFVENRNTSINTEFDACSEFIVTWN